MITKKLSPKGKSVRVTFELSAEEAQEKVAVVGDFNDWNAEKDIMTFDTKKGVWKKALSLKPGNTYEFRYFVDNSQWQNDAEADGYTQTPFFSENGVLEV